ncbi:protein of unknown function [Azospirillum baldaniorum]|uniref:Uncharacterized protein n=1 Tax=Azospirillum baldaniorum TaxID=1064539 RepID=A0A9P1JP05_9PROT|nr:protein of unknown function [Azospirillum baldaniorum]
MRGLLMCEVWEEASFLASARKGAVPNCGKWPVCGTGGLTGAVLRRHLNPKPDSAQTQ